MIKSYRYSSNIYSKTYYEEIGFPNQYLFKEIKLNLKFSFIFNHEKCKFSLKNDYFLSLSILTN